MSVLCHRCGPVVHEAPTVLCAPCVLNAEKMMAEVDAWRDEILVKMSDQDFEKPTKAMIDLFLNNPRRH